MSIFFTIGYQGTDPESFLSELSSYDIELLIDVRELPLSRKKGFSKRQLMEMLAADGIEYEHHRDLGSPRELRNKLRQDHAYGFADFAESFIATRPKRLHILEQLSRQSEDKRICLMCFEGDASGCHRSILSNEMIELGLGATEVVHL